MPSNQDAQVKNGIVFLVTTKANHNVTSTKHIQISEARSHAAARHHAQRRRHFPEASPIDGGTEFTWSLRDAAIIQETTNSYTRTPCAEKGVQDETSLQIRPRRNHSLPVRRKGEAAVRITSDSDGCIQSTRVSRTHPTKVVLFHDRQRFSKLHESNPSMVCEIHSTLDPFIHLPLDVSSEEKSLLHNYLLVGRLQVLGSPMVSKTCPGLDIAQSTMQLCPIYSLTHIVVGEMLSSRAAQRPVRSWYYLRYSQVYRQLNKLLADPEVGVYRKLCAILQVAMVERVVNRPDLEALHTAAMDDLVESHGNLTSIRLHKDDANFANVATRFYADHMIRETIVIRTAHRFTIVKTRFMRAVRRICAWTLLPNDRISDAKYQSPWERPHLKHNLSWLSMYFEMLEDEQLLSHSGSALSRRDKEALISALSLVMTFVECKLHLVAARSFLELVESYICNGNRSTSDNTASFVSVNQITIAHNISCARTASFPDPDYIREMKISQTLADAQAVLTLLDSATAASVTVWLIAIVKNVLSANSHSLHDELRPLALSRNRSDALAWGIERGWKRQTEKTNVSCS